MSKGWLRRKLEWLGFAGNSIDEDDEEVGFTPISAALGDYINKEEFSRMRDGIVAIEFVREGVVELYRVGIKTYTVDDELWHVRGLWPIDGSENTRSSETFNGDTYGKYWRAFHVTLPINAKELGVIEYSY